MLKRRCSRTLSQAVFPFSRRFASVRRASFGLATSLPETRFRKGRARERFRGRVGLMRLVAASCSWQDRLILNRLTILTTPIDRYIINLPDCVASCSLQPTDHVHLSLACTQPPLQLGLAVKCGVAMCIRPLTSWARKAMVPRGQISAAGDHRLPGPDLFDSESALRRVQNGGWRVLKACRV